MTCHRRGFASAFALALVLPLALAACGRKGPLDPPPSAALPPAPAPASSVAPGPQTYVDPLTPIGTAQQAAPPAVATQALPAPTQPMAKSFILDPLIR